MLQDNMVFEGTQLVKSKGEGGRSPEILKLTGLVCRVIFKHESEKTLYVTGDTVWYDAVEEVVAIHRSEVIVVNSGEGFDSIVMDEEDIYEVHKADPTANIISVHMEAIDHWRLSREELKNFSAEKDMSLNALVPEDGEAYSF